MTAWREVNVVRPRTIFDDPEGESRHGRLHVHVNGRPFPYVKIDGYALPVALNMHARNKGTIWYIDLQLAEHMQAECGAYQG